MCCHQYDYRQPECCCEERVESSHCCGEGETPHFQRRFSTKAAEIAELETYLGELKQEMQAVEEHLADLRK